MPGHIPSHTSRIFDGGIRGICERRGTRVEISARAEIFTHTSRADARQGVPRYLWKMRDVCDDSEEGIPGRARGARAPRCAQSRTSPRMCAKQGNLHFVFGQGVGERQRYRIQDFQYPDRARRSSPAGPGFPKFSTQRLGRLTILGEAKTMKAIGEGRGTESRISEVRPRDFQ